MVKLFAIADLHMDGGAGKPMDVFGQNWDDHCSRIFNAWREAVSEDDTVLIPGDISWAMKFKDALQDIRKIAELPGKKVLTRGNHDYWWGSLTQMRAALPESVKLVQNDAQDLGEFTVCGSRGWMLPSDPDFKAADRKIYERELIRLEFSLSAAERLGNKPKVCMLHFPPLHADGEPTGFSELLEKHRVKLCVYGHLHGASGWETGFKGEKNGVRYELCSADSLDFKPKLINASQGNAL